MNKGHQVRIVSLAILLILLPLTLTFIAPGPALAAPQYNTTCSSCHGMPPIDAPTRDIVTGGSKGNHQTHQPASAVIQNCAVCHNASGYTNSHMNGQIGFQANINSSPATGQYKVSGVAVTFKNQTSVPVLGSCSSVNCHFEAVSPTWGSAAYTYTSSTVNDCDQCHGLPPAGTSPSYIGGAAGSHAKHDAYYNGAANCVKCHADHVAEANKFAHATSAGNRNLIVAVKDPANVTGGAYTGAVNDFLPSQTNAFGTCSALYCHSDGTRTSSFKSKSTATWGSGTLTCDKCHGYDTTSSPAFNIMSSGRHTSHVNNAANVGRNIGCQECHAATTSGANTISNVANHVDKNVNVKFDNVLNLNTDGGTGPTYNGTSAIGAAGATKAPGSAVGSCANVYCHSDGNVNGATPTFKTIAWNAAAIGCTTTSCHGNGTKSHPVYANGGAGSATANNHVIHVESRGLSCDYCHINTTTSTALPPTSVVNGGSHLNRVENVDFKSYGGLTGGYNGSKQCSNTYCHSDGNGGPALATAQWGGALNCRGCHGGDADHTNVLATNKHRAHLDPSFNTQLGTGTGFKCAECHVKTINTFANNTTITNPALHVNTLKDYSGARAGKIIAAGQCSNVYCHSSGAKIPTYRNMTGSKLWTGTGSLSCKSCHGYGAGAFTSTLGEPNYANGGIGTNTANNHSKHVVDAGFTSTTQCGACHDHTVDAAVANKLKNYTTQHIDGTRDVIFSAKVGGSYVQGSQTCSSTKCHGTSSPPQWGGAPLACNACHGAAFTSFSSVSKKGAHKQHYETNNFSTYIQAPGNYGTAGLYQFACASCHAAPAAHADLTYPTSFGVAQVYFGYTSAGKKPAYNYGAATAGTDSGTFTWTAGGSTSCNNTYCHSNGRGGVAATAINWGSPEGALGANCQGCHGNETNASTLSGRHDSHVANASANYSGMAFKCADCHGKTITNANNRTLTDKRLHVNKFADYSGIRAGKQSSYNKGTGVCSGIYCHSDGKGATVATPAWTATAAPLACNGCHANTSPSHPAHVVTNNITCNKCHNVTAASNTALQTGTTSHINGTYNVNGVDVKFASFSSAWKATYSAAGKTCSTIYCHSDGHGTYQTPTWGTTLTCNSCHPFSALSAGHAKHIDLTQTSVFYTYTANRSSGDEGLSTAVYRFGCSNCHPTDEATYHTNGTVDVTIKPATGAGALRNKNVNITADGINVAGSHVFKTGSTLTCDNVYCHTNGYAANTNWNNVTPAWTGSFANADRCANCHGNSPNVTIAGSPAHTAHVVGIHADDIFSGVIGKLSAGTGGTGGNTTAASHGSAVQATTINCNICHNTTVTYARNDRNPSCSTTGCHATPTNMAQINNRANHVNGRVDVSFQNIAIVSKAQLRSVSFSDYTAAGGYWTRNGGATPHYKDGGLAYDTAKSALNTATMWNSTTDTCSNVACHMGKSVVWNSTLTCQGCHSKL